MCKCPQNHRNHRGQFWCRKLRYVSSLSLSLYFTYVIYLCETTGMAGRAVRNWFVSPLCHDDHVDIFAVFSSLSVDVASELNSYPYFLRPHRICSVPHSIFVFHRLWGTRTNYITVLHPLQNAKVSVMGSGQLSQVMTAVSKWVWQFFFSRLNVHYFLRDDLWSFVGSNKYRMYSIKCCDLNSSVIHTSLLSSLTRVFLLPFPCYLSISYRHSFLLFLLFTFSRLSPIPFLDWIFLSHIVITEILHSTRLSDRRLRTSQQHTIPRLDCGTME